MPIFQYHLPHHHLLCRSVKIEIYYLNDNLYIQGFNVSLNS